jgi:hypothetical protein
MIILGCVTKAQGAYKATHDEWLKKVQILCPNLEDQILE